MTKQRALHKEKLLAELIFAADEGRRCPTTPELTYQHGIPAASTLANELAREGRIRIEVYARNWRVVEIVGAGLRTAESPHGGAPYLVIDQHGRRAA